MALMTRRHGSASNPGTATTTGISTSATSQAWPRMAWSPVSGRLGIRAGAAPGRCSNRLARAFHADHPGTSRRGRSTRDDRRDLSGSGHPGAPRRIESRPRRHIGHRSHSARQAAHWGLRQPARRSSPSWRRVGVQSEYPAAPSAPTTPAARFRRSREVAVPLRPPAESAPSCARPRPPTYAAAFSARPKASQLATAASPP